MLHRWSIVGGSLVAPLLRLEGRLMPVLGRLMVFRLFVVPEKRGAHA